MTPDVFHWLTLRLGAVYFRPILKYVRLSVGRAHVRDSRLGQVGWAAVQLAELWRTLGGSRAVPDQGSRPMSRRNAVFGAGPWSARDGDATPLAKQHRRVWGIVLTNAAGEAIQVTVDRAITVFDEISGSLYDQPASLEIKATADGSGVFIHRPDIASDGVGKMQIFTFDLMLELV